jgi:hypothetical protein
MSQCSMPGTDPPQREHNPPPTPISTAGRNIRSCRNLSSSHVCFCSSEPSSSPTGDEASHPAVADCWAPLHLPRAAGLFFCVSQTITPFASTPGSAAAALILRGHQISADVCVATGGIRCGAADAWQAGDGTKGPEVPLK